LANSSSDVLIFLGYFFLDLFSPGVAIRVFHVEVAGSPSVPKISENDLFSLAATQCCTLNYHLSPLHHLTTAGSAACRMKFGQMARGSINPRVCHLALAQAVGSQLTIADSALGQTIMAPAAAFTMACVLFLQVMTWISNSIGG
jgi:hypothetical protein